MIFKKQSLLIGIMGFLFGILGSQAISAANILKIVHYEVQPNANITIQLEAENTNPFVAFQADIPIPSGFNYVASSAQLNAARISGHLLSASLLTGNILRLIGFSISNSPFLGTTGSLVSFTLKSGSVPGTFPLQIIQPLLSNNLSANILTGTTNGDVTVLAPNIRLSVTVIDFGRVPLQTSPQLTFQIYNDGNRDLVVTSLNFNDSQFTSVDLAGFTIRAGSNRSVAIKFTPQAKGTFSKQLQILSNDPDQPTSAVSLSAVAFAVNEIHTGNISGASSHTGTLDFTLNNMESFTGFQFDLNLPQPMTYSTGSAQLFRSLDHMVSVSQLNATTLRVLAFSVSNKNFTGNNGKVLTLGFLLNGVAGGYSVGISNVLIANILGENIVSASTGGQLQITSPDIDASTQHNFGEVSILSKATQAHRIFNYGQEPLIINQLMFSSDYFRSSQTFPVTIQPSQYLDLPVEFEKGVKGAVSGTLKILSNDPDENPFTVQLAADAFTPNYLVINPISANRGATVTVPVEINNVEPFVAFQFDLTYPTGFTPDLNNIVLTLRKQDHQIAVSALSSTSIRIIAFSFSQKTFSGTSGAVVNIPFTVGAGLATGTYSLAFSNSIISNATLSNILHSTTNGILTITDVKMLNATVMLDGCYNGQEMNTLLKNYIPLSQPYNTPPWNYAGTEHVASLPTGVVDWILVELRQAATPAAAIPATVLSGWPKACFLKSNGSIVDLDGTSLPSLGNPSITGNLYVIIRHRNHIAIMSSGGIPLVGNNYTYNFTDAITKAYGGSSGYKLLAGSVYGMVSGDSNSNGDISVLDFTKWATDFGKSGIYLTSDINSDGQVSVLDFTKWATNFGQTNITPVKSLGILAPALQSPVRYSSQVPGN